MAEPNVLSSTETIVGLVRQAWGDPASGAVATIVGTPTKLQIEERDGNDQPDKWSRTWGRLTIRHNEADAYALGSRYQNLGSFYINVFVPKGTTAGHLAKRCAHTIASALKAYTGELIELSRVRVNEIGVDGSWYCVNVLADFEFLQPN